MYQYLFNIYVTILSLLSSNNDLISNLSILYKYLYTPCITFITHDAIILLDICIIRTLYTCLVYCQHAYFIFCSEITLVENSHICTVFVFMVLQYESTRIWVILFCLKRFYPYILFARKYILRCIYEYIKWKQDAYYCLFRFF